MIMEGPDSLDLFTRKRADFGIILRMEGESAENAAGNIRLETIQGTIRSVVYHNDENGYTVLRVETPSEFELARAPDITVVG